MSVWNGQRSFRDRGEPTPYPRGDRDGPNNNRTTATSVCTVLGHLIGIPCVPPSRAWALLFSLLPLGETGIEKTSSGWRRGGGGRNDAVVYRAGSLCKRAKELVSEAAGGGCLCSGACSFDQARVCKTQSPRANSKSGEKAVSERSRIHKRSKVYRVFCSANAEASSKEAKSG